MELMGHRTFYTQLCTPFLDSFSPDVSRPRPLLVRNASPHLIPHQIGWVPISCMEDICQCMRAAMWWLLKQLVGSKLGQLHYTSSTCPMNSCNLSCTRVLSSACALVYRQKILQVELQPPTPYFCLLMLCLWQEIIQVLAKHDPGLAHNLWTQIKGCPAVTPPRGQETHC